MFNSRPGFGLQIQWRPTGSLSIIANDYARGQDTLGNARRTRFHSDNSLEVKFLDQPVKFLDKAAFSLTVDTGRDIGGGAGGSGGSPCALELWD